jgi:hypothetical protein
MSGYWATRQGDDYLVELFSLLLSVLITDDPHIGLPFLEFLTDGFFPACDKASLEVEVSTRVRTEHGIPNIELRSPEAFSLIAVRTGVSTHRDTLESYRAILNESDASATQLVLLAEHNPPGGIHEHDHVIKWFQLAEELENLLREGEISSRPHFGLCEFMADLRSRNLAHIETRSRVIEALKLHETTHGDEAIKFEQITSLAHLEEYPELAPLNNLLKLMGEALDAIGYQPKPRFDSGKHHGGWVGYNLSYMRHYFTICYTNPEVLVFDTQLRGGWIQPSVDLYIGGFVSREGRTFWENRLDLSSPIPGILSLEGNEQLELLKEFCRESIRQAEAVLAAM